MDFPSGPVVKNPPASAGDTGSIPAPGSSHVGPCATTTEPVLPNKREEQEKNGESEVAQSCLTLCDPMDCSLAGSSIYGIFLARILVAISFSRRSSRPRGWTWVPVHQPQASSIVHRTWTGNSFHTWYFTCFNAILPNLPTLSLSHSKSLQVINAGEDVEKREPSNTIFLRERDH